LPRHVTICHKSKKGEKTLTVGYNAVEPHMAHGDYYGSCWAPSRKPR
jgi:hypothetical protein